MKKNIALIYGGNSSEHEISVQSAKNVHHTIDQTKYNVYPIEMKGISFTLKAKDCEGIKIDKNQFSFTKDGKKIIFDCAVIIIHGTPGEDGILQAYFDLIGLPYTCSNVLASSLTFNKFYCNEFLRASEINLANSYLYRTGQPINTKEIIKKLGLPVFVKPNAGGSSFGITKVKSENELTEAILKAELESKEVIIEQFIEGTEVTCGVIHFNDKTIALPLTEIVSKTEFFDYKAKYNPEFSEEITPARISDDLTKVCQNSAIKIFDLLNCKGIVRMDFILKDNKFFFLEVNTIPGATANSIIPKMAKVAGISLTDVYTYLIEKAIQDNEDN